jgi:hypothetical protein
MEINAEGHLLTSPREVCERLNQPARLINDVFIPGTPVAFPTYARYCDFLAYCADGFGVHPRNLLVRGSTKLGFSISPDAESAWVEMRPDSDLDLAIIDPDYYHFLDREIRMWERNPENRAFSGIQFSKSIARRKQRGFYTYRYFDLPQIGCVTEHTARLKALPVEACADCPDQSTHSFFAIGGVCIRVGNSTCATFAKHCATDSNRVATFRAPSKTRNSDLLGSPRQLLVKSRRLFNSSRPDLNSSAMRSRSAGRLDLLSDSIPPGAQSKSKTQIIEARASRLAGVRQRAA